MAQPTANLNNTGTSVDSSKDGIIIKQNLSSIEGGRTLDTTGFADDTISAGHLVIKETATGIYKPMPTTGANYAALPAGHTYEGVVVASVLKAKPFVGIMYRGTVNPAACKYVPSSAVITAVQAAQTGLKFLAD